MNWPQQKKNIYIYLHAQFTIKYNIKDNTHEFSGKNMKRDNKYV